MKDYDRFIVVSSVEVEEEFNALERRILELLTHTPDMTNQQIRVKINQERKLPSQPKKVINTTLHTLHSRGFIQFRSVGPNKHWNVAQ